MSAISPLPLPSYPWPADVLAFAAREKVSQYLQPLLEATHRVFPTAEVTVFFERDVELRDLEYIVFEVHVPLADLPDLLASRHQWSDETFRVCPAPWHGAFVFSLRRVAP